MTLPDGWRALPRTDLIRLAHDMNVWNCNQSWSHSAHMAHYHKHIHPIHLYLAKE